MTSPSVVSGADVAAKTQDAMANPIAALSSIAYSIVHFQANNAGNGYAMMTVWAVFLVITIVLAIATVRVARQPKRLDEGAPLHAKAKARSNPSAILAFCWVSFVICLGIMLLVYLALYLQYTPMATPGVMGMQFRYVNPLAPSLALCFRSGWNLIGNASARGD